MGDDEKELNRVRLIFELISEEYNAEKTRKDNINERASKIIIFVGILIGLQSSFGGLLLKDISKVSAFYFSYLNAFILSLIFLVISIICGIYAYRIESWTTAPTASKTIRYGHGENKKSKLQILQIVSDVRTEAINKNANKIDKKARYVKIGYLFFLLGLITILIFIISLFYTNPTLYAK